VSARPLSLPSAEYGIAFLAVLAGVAIAPLAASSPHRVLYLLVAGLALIVVFRSLIAGLALFIMLTFPDQLPGSLGVGPTLAKPLGIVIVISWVFAIAGDRQRVIPFLPRDSPAVTSILLAFLVWSLASTIWAVDRGVALHNVVRLVQLVALVFVAYSAVRAPRHLLILIWALLAGAAAAFTT